MPGFTELCHRARNASASGPCQRTESMLAPIAAVMSAMRCAPRWLAAPCMRLCSVSPTYTPAMTLPSSDVSERALRYPVVPAPPMGTSTHGRGARRHRSAHGLAVPGVQPPGPAAGIEVLEPGDGDPAGGARGHPGLAEGEGLRETGQLTHRERRSGRGQD